MRKLKLLLAAGALLGTGQAWAQTDVTSTYLTNADFSQGTPITVGVCTYAKDAAGNGTTYSQLVAVDGWDIPANGDARAGGLIAFGSGVWIGGPGYTAPTTNSDGDADGNILGLVGVWGGTAQYTQNATLSAGTYTLVLGVYNSVGGTTAFTKNLIGFIEDGGTEHLATTTVYSVNTWKYEFITFTLASETSGKFTLGYQGSNVGSSNAQHLFLSGIQLFDGEVDAEAYEAAKEAARNAKEVALNKEKLAGSSYATPSADLLVNGSFDTANSGWTLTNMGYQQNGERQTRYVEKWQSGALTGSGSATQIIKNLPAGVYHLKGTVNAQLQSNQSLEITGATLSVNSSSINTSGPWKDYEIIYNHENDGDINVTFAYNNSNANWVCVDGFSLVYGGEDYDQYLADRRASLLSEVVAEAEALKTSLAETVPAAIISQLEAIVAEYDGKACATDEELNTSVAAVRTVINKANAYSEKWTAVQNITSIIESTNVYTTAAYNTYNGLVTNYNAGTLTIDEVGAIVDPKVVTGWHASQPDVSAFLMSAWDSELDAWDGMHTNTWSAAGDFGATGFAVPLVEYWVGSGSLAAKTMTATVSGLEAGNYKVSANMFVKATTTPTGVSMQIGDAAAAAITGTQNGDFFVSTATAYGAVGDDGNLTIKLIVADGNNTNWVGFQNMKYEKVNVDYSELNAAIAAANATNAKIAGGVQALTDAIAVAEALLTSLVQDDIDAGVSTLSAATTAAEATIVARLNLAGVAKKATALKSFIDTDIDSEVAAATSYAANAEATAAEANSKATALNAYFASWQTVNLTNADFNTGLNGELIAPGTEEKPYVHAVTGWTQNFTFSSTASQGIAAAYGSAAQDGTNGVAAPATDMFGKSEGGTLHLSSGWNDQARYYQVVETLPAGKYVFYYEGFNANNTEASLNSNYFGLGSLTAGDLAGTNNTFVYSDEKSFTYNEWKAVAFDFTLAKKVTEARVNVGVIGGTADSANTPKMWFDNVTIYCIEEFPEVTIDENVDYTAEASEMANVTLSRTFSDTNWNTFVVPFDIDNSTLTSKFADVEIAEFSETADGDNSTISFTKMATPAITANTPVLLKTTTTGDITFEGVEIKDGEAKVACTNFDFVGTYNATTDIAEGDYFISANKLYKSAGATTVKGTRAYLKTKNAGARIAAFVIGDETTGIAGVENTSKANDRCYDLQGRMVNADNQQLKGGLYIKNGRKVVVK